MVHVKHIETYISCKWNFRDLEGSKRGAVGCVASKEEKVKGLKQKWPKKLNRNKINLPSPLERF